MRQLIPGPEGDDEPFDDTLVAADVIERLMSSRSTRVAWLLGFLTGSALAADEGDAVPPSPPARPKVPRQVPQPGRA